MKDQTYTVSNDIPNGVINYNATLRFKPDNLTAHQCDLVLNFTFYELTTNKPFNDYFQDIDNLGLRLDMFSPDCSLNIKSDFLAKDSLLSTSDELKYFLLSGCVTLLSCIAGLIAAYKFKHKPREAAKVASFTLVSFVVFDFILIGALLIVRQMTRSFFEWGFLVTPLFVTFIVDFHVFMKKELAITFVSDPRELNIACKEYVGLMGCCMMGCLLLIIAILTFSSEAVFIFCFAVYALYPLPQIIYNFS